MNVIDRILTIISTASRDEKTAMADFFAHAIYTDMERLKSKTEEAVCNTELNTARGPKDEEMLNDCETLMEILRKFYNVKAD